MAQLDKFEKLIGDDPMAEEFGSSISEVV